MIDSKHIISACKGENKVEFQLKKIDKNNNITLIEKIESPCLINIYNNYFKIQMDLMFLKNELENLSKTNKLFLKAFDLEQNSKNDCRYQISIIIHPQKYKGCEVCFSDPILWALTAINPFKKIDTLRVAFDIFEVKNTKTLKDTLKCDANFSPFCF